MKHRVNAKEWTRVGDQIRILRVSFHVSNLPSYCIGGGGGCEYSFKFSKQRNDSFISLIGRNGNSLWSVMDVGGVFWLWINVYSSL